MFRGDIVPFGLQEMVEAHARELDDMREKYLAALLGQPGYSEFKRLTGTDWPIIGGDAPD